MEIRAYTETLRVEKPRGRGKTEAAHFSADYRRLHSARKVENLFLIIATSPPENHYKVIQVGFKRHQTSVPRLVAGPWREVVAGNRFPGPQ